jgi:hypothetical protein
LWITFINQIWIKFAIHTNWITRISCSSFQSIVIPRNVEILGSKWFSDCQSLSLITLESNSRLAASIRLKVIPEEAFSLSGLLSISIPAAVRIVEKRAFYRSDSFTELMSAEGITVKVIENEAFGVPQLEKLVILGSLQYIGARMCPSTTELLLTRESRIPMFEEWRASCMGNRNEVMGGRQRTWNGRRSGWRSWWIEIKQVLCASVHNTNSTLTCSSAWYHFTPLQGSLQTERPILLQVIEIDVNCHDFVGRSQDSSPPSPRFRLPRSAGPKTPCTGPFCTGGVITTVRGLVNDSRKSKKFRHWFLHWLYLFMSLLSRRHSIF